MATIVSPPAPETTSTLDQAPRTSAHGTHNGTKQRKQRTRQQRNQRRWANRMVPITLLLLGMIVLIYPVAGTYYNNYKQTEFAREYDQRVGTAQSSTLTAALAEAHRYNKSLRPTLLADPYTNSADTPSDEYATYLATLDEFDAMARLRIPSIGVDLPIYHGTSEHTLAQGVGHFFGSALPVGGKGTRAVLTGHSSLAEATLFDNLDKVALGETFFIDVYGQTLAYQVTKRDIVLPDDIEGVFPVKGKDLITLVTCTPYAINSHRLLVTAERVPYESSSDTAKATLLGVDWTPQSWMWPRMLATLATLLVLIAMILGWIRSDRRRARRLAARAAKRAAAAQLSADEPVAEPGSEPASACTCAASAEVEGAAGVDSLDPHGDNSADGNTDGEPAEDTHDTDDPRTPEGRAP